MDPINVVIETQNLTKRYGDQAAVQGLNLRVPAGEVFGLLGPNGSGKTTTILMLLGLTEPSDGQVRVLGLDPVRAPLQVKAHVGYLPDSVGFYDELSAFENLAYIARLNGLPRADAGRRIGDALERMGLSEVAQHRVGTFSRGMRQRLGLAEILLKHPKVIILDEPTLGLDPEAARDFLRTIRRFKEEGITVLLSSHLLHQVQAICDRVGLFHRGKMVLEGSVQELAQRVLGNAFHIHLETQGGSGLERELQSMEGVTVVAQQSPNRHRIEASADVRAEAAQRAIRCGAQLLSLSLDYPSLDEVYAHYFKEVEHAAA